jgi:tetratricopeptide (TPR) repeat protein
VANEEARALRQQGIAAAKAGQKEEARALLQQAIRLEPGNEAAWMWLASVARDQRERVFALQKLLEINPDNATARQALDSLSATGAPSQSPAPVKPLNAPSAPPAPESSAPVQPFAFEPSAEAQAVNVPLPAADSVSAAQKQADSLINAWIAAQATPDIQWVHKTKGRAGEGDIVRLRAQVGGVIVAALAVLVIVGALLVTTNEDVRSVVFAPTPTSSPTPTATFTPTPGLTPTPSQAPRRPPTETPVPPFFMQGADLYNLPAATPIYPVVLSKPLEDAVEAVNRGLIAEALPTLSAERRQTDNEFKAQPYYYEAIALIAQGELAEARALLDEAQERITERSTATERALLASAEAQWAYAEGEELLAANQRSRARASFDEARDQAVAALGPDAARALGLEPASSAPGDALLSQPYVILSRILRQNRDYDQALAVLDSGLEQRRLPSNVELLVEKGRVYFDQRDYDLADTQAALALFVDPRTAAAHTLRIGASLAQNQPGRAVLQAQDYLYYVPGSAEAWKLLGDARLAEGNGELALLAWSQALTGSDERVQREALLSRAALFEQRRQWDRVREDLTDALNLQDDDATRVRRMIAAYHAGSFGAAESDAEALAGSSALPEAELALWTARILMDGATGDSSAPFREALNQLAPLLDAESGLDEAQRPLLLELLARAHLGSGSEDTALGFIDQALAAGETPERHLIRGLIFEAQDEPEAARQEYDWVLTWDDIAPVAAAGLAAERLDALNEGQ